MLRITSKNAQVVEPRSIAQKNVKKIAWREGSHKGMCKMKQQKHKGKCLFGRYKLPYNT